MYSHERALLFAISAPDSHSTISNVPEGLRLWYSVDRGGHQGKETNL